MGLMIVLALLNVVLWGSQGFGLVAPAWLLGIPVFGYRLLDAMD
ncbi:hypothetical protein [Haloarchaeobius iranensis]|nr:hypothetical protein [Haloarchaeobius iranensis]